MVLVVDAFEVLFDAVLQRLVAILTVPFLQKLCSNLVRHLSRLSYLTRSTQ